MIEDSVEQAVALLELFVRSSEQSLVVVGDGRLCIDLRRVVAAIEGVSHQVELACVLRKQSTRLKRALSLCIGGQFCLGLADQLFAGPVRGSCGHAPGQRRLPRVSYVDCILLVFERVAIESEEVCEKLASGDCVCIASPHETFARHLVCIRFRATVGEGIVLCST